MSKVDSTVSPFFQTQNSSHQAAWNCGPRKPSRLSAEKAKACAPFGQTSRPRELSNTGRCSFGAMASKPDSPSIITLRTSA